MVTDPAGASTHFALSVDGAVTVSGRAPWGGAGTRRKNAMTDTERDPAGSGSGSGARPVESLQSPEPESPESPVQPQPQPQPPSLTTPEPGRVWGIVSLALSVIPVLQLVGLAAGVVGLVLSSRAGRRNWFAVAGVATSLLLLIAAGTFVVLFAFLGYGVFGGTVGSVVTVCSELGRGEHVVDGLTYSCR
jgi:hypothetical protein